MLLAKPRDGIWKYIVHGKVKRDFFLDLLGVFWSYSNSFFALHLDETDATNFAIGKYGELLPLRVSSSESLFLCWRWISTWTNNLLQKKTKKRLEHQAEITTLCDLVVIQKPKSWLVLTCFELFRNKEIFPSKTRTLLARLEIPQQIFRGTFQWKSTLYWMLLMTEELSFLPTLLRGKCYCTLFSYFLFLWDDLPHGGGGKVILVVSSPHVLQTTKTECSSWCVLLFKKHSATREMHQGKIILVSFFRTSTSILHYN